MFEADFTKKLRDFSLEVSGFTVESGKTVGLIGENGSGKSTSLKIISGLMKPESGKIILDGEVLCDSSKRIFKDPEVRNIGYMFQNYALFPHMTARENISFGLKNKKMPKADIKSRVDELVERMGIAEIENEPVTKMSGGQRQRTALARALAPSPSLLLLDEPLAALDVRTQEQMRRELASAIREEGTSCILVTHSIIDAMAIADSISVIQRGKIIASGQPEEILHNPLYGFTVSENPNIFRGEVFVKEGGAVCVNIGKVCMRAVTTLSGTVSVSIRPEEIIISKEKLLSSAVNSFTGKITDISFTESEVFVHVDVGIELAVAVTKQSLERLGLKKGDTVTATFKATAVKVFA